MKCRQPNCTGDIEMGQCQNCGNASHQIPEETSHQSIISTVRSLLQPGQVSPSKDDLSEAAKTLRTVVPYNYDAWRLHADLLLNALNQLQTRQLQPDPAFTLLAIPLREEDLRDAAEETLRECAHFADSDEKRITLVDEANRIRRLSWF